MKTANELNRPTSETAQIPAPEVSNPVPRYRPREIGVGYGKSSGYARASSYVAGRGAGVKRFH